MDLGTILYFIYASQEKVGHHIPRTKKKMMKLQDQQYKKMPLVLGIRIEYSGVRFGPFDFY